tara:strand:- start:407 stop:619 length:213 start_codon:yes stop_codon:yes gene_type:complete
VTNKAERKNFQSGREASSVSRGLVYWVLILGTIGVWYSIFTNGFFTTIMWLIIISAIAGIIMRVKEDTRV